MKFHEFGDKNLPPVLLIHGGVALGGIILDKLVSCLIITMSFYPHLMDTEKSIKRIIYQRKIRHRKF